MKKNLILFFIFGMLFLSAAPKAFAILVRPLGGMILTAPITGVTCPTSTTSGQWSIRPYNLASPAPYLILTTGPKRQPRPGAYFMGNYIAAPLPICYSGNVPVPTFVIEGLIYQATQ